MQCFSICWVYDNVDVTGRTNRVQTKTIAPLCRDPTHAGIDGSDIHRTVRLVDRFQSEKRYGQFQPVIAGLKNELRLNLPTMQWGAHRFDVIAHPRPARMLLHPLLPNNTAARLWAQP